MASRSQGFDHDKIAAFIGEKAHNPPGFLIWLA
jgi:hypothetical protein